MRSPLSMRNANNPPPMIGVQIIGAIVAPWLAVHQEPDVGKRHIYIAPVSGRAPLDAAHGAAFADARLP